MEMLSTSRSKVMGRLYDIQNSGWFPVSVAALGITSCIIYLWITVLK